MLEGTGWSQLVGNLRRLRASDAEEVFAKLPQGI